MREILLIGMGGFVGAIARYGLSGWVQSISGRIDFPYGTLAVNVLGSFVLGFLFFLAQARGIFAPSFREFAFIGMLGAFTTFSTFSLETVSLLLEGDRLMAVMNVLLSLLLCLLGVWLARLLVLSIWG